MIEHISDRENVEAILAGRARRGRPATEEEIEALTDAFAQLRALRERLKAKLGDQPRYTRLSL
jgi:hypothetical protein